MATKDNRQTEGGQVDKDARIAELEDRVAELEELVTETEHAGREEGARQDDGGFSRRAILSALTGTGILGLGAGGLFASSASGATAPGYTETGELRDENGNILALLNNGGPFEFQVPIQTDILNTGWILDAADYPDLQSALDDAESTGVGVVVVPPGNYNQSSTLEIPENVTLLGLGNPFSGRPNIKADSNVDPVVGPKTTRGLGVALVGVEITPDGSEDAWGGDVHIGHIKNCSVSGDINITSDGGSSSRAGAVLGCQMKGNDITADSGVESSFLIANNREVGTITSNSATEGTNS